MATGGVGSSIADNRSKDFRLLLWRFGAHRRVGFRTVYVAPSLRMGKRLSKMAASIDTRDENPVSKTL